MPIGRLGVGFDERYGSVDYWVSNGLVHKVEACASTHGYILFFRVDIFFLKSGEWKKDWHDPG